VLLRVNPGLPGDDIRQAAASPFGMDEDALAACLPLLAGAPHVRVRGLHAHLTWAAHDAAAMADLARRVADWALPWLRAHLPDLDDPELDLGGGMGVDYHAPERVFDWEAYAAALPGTGARLRIEPGRSLTAYHGWYVTDVLDVKTTRGETYVILRGGTHHLRTPVTKGHDQPFEVLTSNGSALTSEGSAPAADGSAGRATLVGQLCTPKDVLARDVPVPPLAPGDVVAFTMAGAYAWNISHHDFLMHPKPSFHYLR
ncbi:MAG TPA: type III PLP-dependent enzyme, partial [Spirillospora sp.]